MFCNQCEQTAKGVGCTIVGVCGKTEDVAALQDLLTYAVQGLSVVAVEARKNGIVDNAIDLADRLSKSAKVRQSVIRHAFRYFMGRNELLSDSQTLIEADRAYLDSGGSFKALVVSLLSSDSFLYRR